MGMEHILGVSVSALSGLFRTPAFLHSSVTRLHFCFSQISSLLAPQELTSWEEAASCMAHFPSEAHSPRDLCMKELGLMNLTSLQVAAILFSVLSQIP